MNTNRLVWIAVAVVALGYAAFAVGRGGSGGGTDRVPWGHDVREAAAAAEQSGRPLLLNFTADWCPPCQEMKRSVYSDEAVAAWMGEHAVPVKVDLTSPGGPAQDLAETFGVSSIPTLVMFDRDGKPAARVTGYVDRDDLLAWLTEQRDAVKSAAR